MSNDQLGNFLRTYDPAQLLDSQRLGDLQVRILAATRNAPASGLSNAATLPGILRLQVAGLMTGAMVMLALGFFTGISSASGNAYTQSAYVQAESPSTTLLASTWHSYMKISGANAP